MRYETVEHYTNVAARDATTPHATYLDALLWLVKRSNRYAPHGCRADVYAVDDGERVLVKTYTGQAFPSTEDVRSAVTHPERTKTFRVGA